MSVRKTDFKTQSQLKLSNGYLEFYYYNTMAPAFDCVHVGSRTASLSIHTCPKPPVLPLPRRILLILRLRLKCYDRDRMHALLQCHGVCWKNQISKCERNIFCVFMLHSSWAERTVEKPHPWHDRCSSVPKWNVIGRQNQPHETVGDMKLIMARFFLLVCCRWAIVGNFVWLSSYECMKSTRTHGQDYICIQLYSVYNCMHTYISLYVQL